MNGLALNFLFLGLWIPYSVLIIHDFRKGQTRVGTFRVKQDTQPKLYWGLTLFQVGTLCFGWPIWFYGTLTGWQ
jgi:hypothetical protein